MHALLPLTSRCGVEQAYSVTRFAAVRPFLQDVQLLIEGLEWQWPRPTVAYAHQEVTRSAWEHCIKRAARCVEARKHPNGMCLPPSSCFHLCVVRCVTVTVRR